MHSTEENAITQLKAGSEAAEDPRLAAVLGEHLKETEEHERLVRTRLGELDASPSRLKDAAQKAGASLLGAVAGSAPDTTGKLAIQAFATEHLEIAAYRSLRAVARRANDGITAELADRILREEEAAAAKLDGLIEEAALVGLPQAA